jgi:hypothetical protein
MCQLVPLLGLTVSEGLLFREEQLSEAAGLEPAWRAPILLSLLSVGALVAIAGGPILGVALARRRIKTASALSFLAALPVSAGWALAWAFIPLWPSWAWELLRRTEAPMHDHPVWLSVANWLYFVPVMSTLAWWGTSFRGRGVVRDIGLVLAATGLSFVFVRWLSPHAFL